VNPNPRANALRDQIDAHGQPRAIVPSRAKYGVIASRIRPTRASVRNPSAPRPVAMNTWPVPGRWFFKGTSSTTTPRFFVGSPAAPLAPTPPLASDLEGDVARRAVAQVRERHDDNLAAALGTHLGDHGFHARHRRGVEHAGEVVDVARGRRERYLRKDDEREQWHRCCRSYSPAQGGGLTPAGDGATIRMSGYVFLDLRGSHEGAHRLVAPRRPGLRPERPARQQPHRHPWDPHHEERIKQSGGKTAWEVIKRAAPVFSTHESRTGRPASMERRGRGSILLEDSPIIMLDGVRVSDFKVLEQIPAETIFSIYILTGAEGTTYYGDQCQRRCHRDSYQGRLAGLNGGRRRPRRRGGEVGPTSPRRVGLLAAYGLRSMQLWVGGRSLKFGLLNSSNGMGKFHVRTVG